MALYKFRIIIIIIQSNARLKQNKERNLPLYVVLHELFVNSGLAALLQSFAMFTFGRTDYFYDMFVHQDC